LSLLSLRNWFQKLSIKSVIGAFTAYFQSPVGEIFGVVTGIAALFRLIRHGEAAAT
jgi:hypothetical protein